ncbi:MAG: hypothetical protein LUC33_07280 [Prevotellaceae bacterium]|nr:hypothetical protein [Prevotellaceae bacterium]
MATAENVTTGGGARPRTGRKASLMKKIRGKYPDREINEDDEESVYGALEDDYDEREGELQGAREREQGLSDMIAGNPQAAVILATIKNGGDFLVELIRLFGDDFKEALSDPEKLEQLEAAQKDYMDRVKRNRDSKEEFMRNIEESQRTIDRLKQKGVSDEDINKGVELLLKRLGDHVMAKFSEDDIMAAIKSVRHDSDVEQARNEGVVSGRNQRITESLRRARGDGQPSLGGTPRREAPKRDEGDFLDMALEAGR